MRFTITTAIAGVALLVVACGTADGPAPSPSRIGTPDLTTPTPEATPAPTPTPEPTPTPTPTPEQAFENPQTCENGELGFVVSYPGDWWANETFEGDQLPRIEGCTFFARGELDLEPGTDDLTGVAIQFREVDTDVERGGAVLNRDETTVDGREAIVQEREPDPTTPMIPDDARIYEYIVPLGDGRELVASTDTIWHDYYEESRAVLDAMMETIEIDER